MTTWHEMDDFWHTFASFMFGESEWEAAPHDIEQVLQLLGLPPGAAVLDMGCGPGRHSLELARRGFRVTGVDRTAAYLRQARQAAEEEGLEVEFVKADMRDFCRADAYQGAVSMYTSFGYFEDAAENQRVLDNLYRSLQPGGRLLVDVMGKEILARIYQRRNWSEEEDGTLVLQDRQVGRDWSWMEVRYIAVRAGEQREFRVSHWIYSATELRSLLQAAGFAEVSVYGDLAGAPYDQHAKRLVAVARKMTA